MNEAYIKFYKKKIEAQKATKGNYYSCISCGSLVFLRQGPSREPHFAHYSNPNIECEEYFRSNVEDRENYLKKIYEKLEVEEKQNHRIILKENGNENHLTAYLSIHLSNDEIYLQDGYLLISFYENESSTRKVIKINLLDVNQDLEIQFDLGNISKYTIEFKDRLNQQIRPKKEYHIERTFCVFKKNHIKQIWTLVKLDGLIYFNENLLIVSRFYDVKNKIQDYIEKNNTPLFRKRLQEIESSYENQYPILSSKKINLGSNHHSLYVLEYCVRKNAHSRTVIDAINYKYAQKYQLIENIEWQINTIGQYQIDTYDSNRLIVPNGEKILFSIVNHDINARGIHICIFNKKNTINQPSRLITKSEMITFNKIKNDEITIRFHYLEIYGRNPLIYKEFKIKFLSLKKENNNTNDLRLNIKIKNKTDISLIEASKIKTVELDDQVEEVMITTDESLKRYQFFTIKKDQSLSQVLKIDEANRLLKHLIEENRFDQILISSNGLGHIHLLKKTILKTKDTQTLNWLTSISKINKSQTKRVNLIQRRLK